MTESYYTVDSAAEKLGVHSRTVLRFINQGTLKAFKVGRQWRIRKEDLAGMTGEPESGNRASASSVMDIPVLNREEADRLQTLVTAALNSRGASVQDRSHRVDCLYNGDEQTVRFIIWGSISFMKDFFTLLDRYVTK